MKSLNEISIINNPDQPEKNIIINALWESNEQFHPVDIQPIFIKITDNRDVIKAGLVAQTWWGGLEIQYLWVSDEYRGKGYGKQMMMVAEKEAINRGCHMAYVDTFNFQAKGFYKKLGYTEYGSLTGYAHKFRRFYLSKILNSNLG